jgi:pyrimidine operon attenuation protein/uracil phosphoribosyltransferase
MMSNQKVIILTKKQIQQKIERMAYQILEDNLDEKEISALQVKLIKIELDKDSSHLQASSDIAIENVKNQAVILVDDVLNSGRTLVYGLGVFLNIPLKKLRILVLVDRSHRSFPVSPDFTGLQLATVLKQHVQVVLDQSGEDDAVYLS